MATNQSYLGALHAQLVTIGDHGLKALQQSEGSNSWLRLLGTYESTFGNQPTKLIVSISAFTIFVIFAFARTALLHLLDSNKRRGRIPATGWSSNFLFGDVFELLWNGPEFMKSRAAKHDWTQPFGIRLGHKMLYNFNDPDHVTTLFKTQQGLHANAVIIHLIQSIMGAPKAMCAIIERDRSGPLHNPQPGHPVPPPNERWRHLIWTIAHKYASRKHVQLGDVYYEKLRATLARDDSITDDWLVGNDFHAYMQDVTYTSSIGMLFGNRLWQMNPGFVEQVRHYHSGVPHLLRCYPRIFFPTAYRHRDKLLASITNWLRWVDAQVQTGDPEEDQKIEYNRDVHGSQFIKAFDDTYQAMPGITMETRAAAILGVIFATNSNTGACIFWALYEVFRRPELLAKIREVARQYRDPVTDRFLPGIFESPLMLSVYSETLRLRVHAFRVTTSDDDHEMDSWRVPKGSFIAMSTTVAHFNPQWWNTGKDNEWPLSEFWAERFIVDPNNPWSGPTKSELGLEKPRVTRFLKDADQTDRTKPYFSTAALDGRFFPFGMGVTKCPGRQIVERETIITLASFVHEFDIEFLRDDGVEVPHDNEFFPLGVLPPKEKVPYRIRKRVIDA